MRRWLALLLCLGLLVAPAAISAANSIAYSPSSPTTATGVYFTVATGGGNRDYASVRVTCTDGSGTVLYGTILTVVVPPKGTADSQTIYPPASSCLAELVKQMSIDKYRVLATTSFTISQA